MVLSKLSCSVPALLANLVSAPALLQLVIFLGIVVLLVKEVGIYLECVFTREQTFLDPLLEPVMNLRLEAVS